MPKPATKGTRSKFYNALARDVRQLDTLTLPSTFISTYTPSRSGESRISNRSPKLHQPKSRVSGYDSDDDDDGWGSIPATKWGRSTHLNEEIRISLTGNSTWGQRDRADVANDHHISPARHPHYSESTNQQLSTQRTRTPTSREKVKSWISNSQETTPQNTDNLIYTSVTPSPSPKKGKKPTNHQDKSSKRSNMNYLHEEIPSTSYRRYGDSSFHPSQTTDLNRDTYRPHNGGIENRQTFSPRNNFGTLNTDLRSPQGLHHTNPFSSTNMYSYRGRESEPAPPHLTGVSEYEFLDKERQAALKRAQELERKMEDRKKNHVHTSYTSQRPSESQEFKILQEENNSLQNTIQRYREEHHSLQSRIIELETHTQSNQSNSTELISLKSELDRIDKENTNLNELLISSEKQIEEERTKRFKAEFDSDSSKKSQSSSAKLIVTLEIKIKELESNLKDLQEKERVSRESKTLMEKRVKGFDYEKATIIADLETWRNKAGMAYREKENAIIRYKAKENDNAKLSDKLNLSRKEKEGIQARLDEVMNEVAQNAEKAENEKPSTDRRKLKEELYRERTTSDRLRSERNLLREQVQKLKIENRSISQARETDEHKPKNINPKLYHPKATSPNDHKPEFSLDDNHKYKARVDDYNEKDKNEKDEIEVIEDIDGVQYEPKRVNLEDDLEDVNMPKAEKLKSPTLPEKITSSNYTSDIQSLLPLKLTMNSIPLEPKRKMETASKEEMSLFSPVGQSSVQKGKDINVEIQPVLKDPLSPHNEVDEQIKEEERKKRSDKYAGLRGMSDKSETQTSDKMKDNIDPKDEKVKPIDPFADLDPLDYNSFSPNPSTRFSQSPTESKEQNRKLGPSLMDLLGSPRSNL